MMEDYTADTPKPARKRSKKGELDGPVTTPGVCFCLNLLHGHQQPMTCQQRSSLQDGAGVALYMRNFSQCLMYYCPGTSGTSGPKADWLWLSAGSADPASQLGVFADRSESDEELLEATTPASLSTAQRGRGKAKRPRGSNKKSSAPGALATFHAAAEIGSAKDLWSLFCVSETCR